MTGQVTQTYITSLQHYLYLLYYKYGESVLKTPNDNDPVLRPQRGTLYILTIYAFLLLYVNRTHNFLLIRGSIRLILSAMESIVVNLYALNCRQDKKDFYTFYFLYTVLRCVKITQNIIYIYFIFFIKTIFIVKIIMAIFTQRLYIINSTVSKIFLIMNMMTNQTFI